MSKIRNVAIFASGNGSNAKKIIERQLSKDVNYRVRVIITNKDNAGVIQHAKDFHIPHFITDKNHDNIMGILSGFKIEVIVLAGYLKLVPSKITDDYYTMNIHPSLLPKHGGKGMYGEKVHESVIKSGDKKSGITIHHVTPEYDKGKIIYFQELDVTPSETVYSLQRRIQVLEHKFYPIVLDEVCKTLETIVLESYTS